MLRRHRPESEPPLSEEELALGGEDSPFTAELAGLGGQEHPGPWFTNTVMRDVEAAPRGPWARLKDMRYLPRARWVRAFLVVPIGAAVASLWFMVVSAETQLRQIESGWEGGRTRRLRRRYHSLYTPA